ncbi:uncharacterized protein [Macrobrachium rosenbergii]|uniref:uncharacterized protein n=1 Tax=Macrobrachium rosenbergii TaxID=79674 RepID=UPI0034D3CBED
MLLVVETRSLAMIYKATVGRSATEDSRLSIVRYTHTHTEPGDTRLVMMSCKLLLLAMLVGTALAAAKPWPLPNAQPQVAVCDNWCGTPPNLVCCDKKCPVDTRPPGECNRPRIGAGSVSGPAACAKDSDCAGGALCCWDSCLHHLKCTNV